MSRRRRKRRAPRDERVEQAARRAAAAYKRSRRALKSGDFDAALAAVREALELEPASPYGHNLAGWVLLQRPNPTEAELEQAVGYFRAAIELDPRDVVPTVNLANALIAQGRDGEAIAMMESHVATHSFAADALNWLGWYWGFRRGETDRAIELLEQAVRIRPWKALPWVNLGTLRKQNGAYEDAYVAYQIALTCSDLEDEQPVEDSARALEEQMIERGEEPPIVIRNELGELLGPELVAVARACRAGRFDDAIAALERLGSENGNYLVDAIGIAHDGARAARQQGAMIQARRLLELVIRGYELYASGATSGAEGLGRMHDVERMRQLLADWS